MNIYIKAPNEIINIIGGPQKRINNKRVRYSKLCIIVDGDGGKVIYNELTKSLVFLTDHDFEVVTKKENEASPGFKYLFENYFLVPENHKEFEVAKKVKQYYLSTMKDDIRTSKITTYTILPTTDCNARCFYCYEKDIRHVDMTEETALKIVKFIIERHDPSRNVFLRWFGGEPLYNIKIIDLICTELKKANINFISNIVTNGYLLEPDVTKRAVEDWGLNHVQITLDGTEKIYNKAKRYIYKNDESPFLHVLNNCEECVKNNIKVSFRLNVDDYNAEDIKNLLDVIYQRFGTSIGISVFPLFESAMKKKRTDEERDKLYQKIYEIEDKARIMGLLVEWPHTTYKSSMCIVDDGHSLMFQPDGSIGVCEHHADSNKMSHIDNPVFNEEDINEWLEKCEPEPGLCNDCPIFPSCVRVKKCEEESVCNKNIKERKIIKEKIGIINLLNEQIKRTQQQQPQQRIVINALEITENGVYTPTEGVNGFSPVIVNVVDKSPYSPVFVAIKNKNKLCIAYLEEDLSYFPEFTKQEFVVLLNNNTNLKDNNIEENDVEKVTESKISWFEIDMLKHPKLRSIDTFEWDGGVFCKGCISLKEGKTKIFKW